LRSKGLTSPRAKGSSDRGKLAVAWKVRGVARVMKDDYAGADSDSRRFLELAPNDPVVPRIRAMLAKIR
jgi:hypothetical protein